MNVPEEVPTIDKRPEPVGRFAACRHPRQLGRQLPCAVRGCAAGVSRASLSLTGPKGTLWLDRSKINLPEGTKTRDGASVIWVWKLRGAAP